jgi:hypothetical protein
MIGAIIGSISSVTFSNKNGEPFLIAISSHFA